MRVASGIFCVMMLGFTAVQYNDPDKWVWIAIYGITAFWSGVAAWAPAGLARPPLAPLFGASFVAGLAALAWFWPQTTDWWLPATWRSTETAREEMGILIVIVALIVAGVPALRRRLR